MPLKEICRLNLQETNIALGPSYTLGLKAYILKDLSLEGMEVLILEFNDYGRPMPEGLYRLWSPNFGMLCLVTHEFLEIGNLESFYETVNNLIICLT